MSRLARGLWWACALALFALCAAWLGARGTVDNRLAAWSVGLGPAPGHELLTERFGGDELVLVRVEEPTRFGLEDLAQEFAALGGQPAVRDRLDPFTLPGGPGGEVAARLRAAADRPLVRALDLLALGPDGRARRVDLVLALALDATPAERAGLLASLEGLERRADERGVELHYAGHPLVAVALDAQSARVERVFAPLLVVAAAALVALVLRSVRLALVTLLPAVAASLGARAALALLGIPTNMILVAVGPLVLVLVVAAALHLVIAERRALSEGLDPERAVRRALERTRAGALLAAATTAVGFGVFVLSPVVAVRQLGATVGLTVAVAVPLAYLALPSMVVGLGGPAGRPRASARRIPRALVRGALRRPRAVVCVSAAVFLLGLAAARSLPAGVDSLDFFPVGHPVREHFLAVERDGGALTALEVLVPVGPELASGPAGGELSRLLSGATGVRQVLGPPEVVEDLRFSLGPLGAAAAGGPLGRAALEAARRVDGGGEWSRWTVRAARGGAADVAGLEAELEARAAAWSVEQHTPAALVTGSVARVVAMQHALARTLATSLGLTAAVVLFAFAATVPDRRTYLAVAAANAVPPAAVLAATWLLGYALDVATVMVASVVLGLAVDNTFHLVRAGRTEGRGRFARLRAGLGAFDRVGAAAFTSTCALAAGFLVLSLSGFAPTARFGGLAAIGVIAAFLADFYLLPVIWLGGGRRGAGRSTASAPGRRRSALRTAPRSVAP